MAAPVQPTPTWVSLRGVAQPAAATVVVLLSGRRA